MKRIAALAFVFMALATGPVLAQDYPTRPIRILSPYSPGGISDIAARIVAGKLTEAWGQQVIVENRPGGNGFIAVTDAARATPDGYTLVMVTAGDITINPSLFKTVPYDVDRDLAPVSAVSDAPLVLAANGETPYKTLADVIAAAKAQPGMLNIGSPGYGSINHLMLESIALNTGTKFTHVPYKGGAPAVQALVAGDIPLAIIASSTAAPHVCERQNSHIGNNHRRTFAAQSGMAAAGARGCRRYQCFELDRTDLAPKAIPQPIIQKLSAKVIEILNMPDVKGTICRRRRVDHSVDAGRARCQDQARTGDYRVVIEKANVHVD